MGECTHLYYVGSPDCVISGMLYNLCQCGEGTAGGQGRLGRETVEPPFFLTSPAPRPANPLNLETHVGVSLSGGGAF